MQAIIFLPYITAFDDSISNGHLIHVSTPMFISTQVGTLVHVDIPPISWWYIWLDVALSNLQVYKFLSVFLCTT